MATATVAHQDTAVHEHHEHEHHDHEHHDNFITKYIFTTDHKMIAKQFLVTGISYRFNESMAANLIYNIKNTVSIGYMYDFPINGLRTYQTGSHEIFLRYDFKPKKSVKEPTL